ncbi:MAG: undecaprenyl-diphosphate phosphatase [Bacillota bacterium]
MNWFSGLILGIVQGLTEFLPVSSSAHLVFVPEILRVKAVPLPLAFDVALHLATLAAVLTYFYGDLRALLAGLFKNEPSSRGLIWLLVLGTIPAVTAGVILKPVFALLKNPPLTACFMMITGLALLWGDSLSNRGKTCRELRWFDAAWIGAAQALAVVPGISRSGATIVAGLARGLSKKQAARFSFLLSIPAICGAGLLESKDILGAQHLAVNPGTLAAGMIAAGVSGYLAIKYFLILLEKKSLRHFAYYCWIAGLAFLAYWYLANPRL